MKLAMDEAIANMVQALANGAVSNRRLQLAEDEEERTSFEARLYDRWGLALDLLRLFRQGCLEAGVEFHELHRPASGDAMYKALVKLHARSCLVADEVIALLRGGFASGAHARWRTAHEIAVVGFFISGHGQETAERYLLHDAVESARAAIDYQQHASKLGYQPFSAEEIASIEDAVATLVARFGGPYYRQYGWAAAVLDNPKPTFRDLEATVSLDHLRPYYRMASHPTHAGPKGIVFDLGLSGQDVMLAGPSDGGLADPGQSIAISLLQITTALLRIRPDMGTIATLTYLQLACDAVAEAFIRAHRLMEPPPTDFVPVARLRRS
ncbi:MAG TPA: DUF5677 domain-containing protein [Solirubrobacteraceae bacterium]|nr:DUF5677 domain-containing protein [Solirubrobacteraceae bacterium]